MPVLVITGATSGIGKATAELFREKGYAVYDLSRRGSIACDVTDEKSVANAIAEVMTKEERIDVLISNAGFGISGPVEFTATEDAKKQFDVNFFGALNVVKAVLPIMRQQRSGRIIFTSSVAAILSVPYQSFYSASKAAINALALALQNEVREFGIYVSVLMPGDVRTGFTAAREKEIRGAEVYCKLEKSVSQMERDEQLGMTPENMARCFYRIATRRYPAPQYVGGTMYALLCFADRILPKRLVNWIEGKLYC